MNDVFWTAVEITLGVILAIVIVNIVVTVVGGVVYYIVTATSGEEYEVNSETWAYRKIR